MEPQGDQRRSTQLLARLVSVIEHHDPLSLRALQAPVDEYEPLARAIHQRITDCTSQVMCLEVVWDAFRKAFGEAAGYRNRYVELSRDIFDVTSRWPNP